MATRKIDLNVPHPDLDALIDLIEDGDEIVLLRGDKEVARLVPVEETTKSKLEHRVPDLFPGIWMSDDFNEPLADEFWLGDDA